MEQPREIATGKAYGIKRKAISLSFNTMRNDCGLMQGSGAGGVGMYASMQLVIPQKYLALDTSPLLLFYEQMEEISSMVQSLTQL